MGVVEVAAMECKSTQTLGSLEGLSPGRVGLGDLASDHGVVLHQSHVRRQALPLRRLGDEFEQKRRQGLAFHALALGRKQGLFGGASRVKTGRVGHRVGDQHASCEPKAPLGMHRARHVRWRICAVGHRVHFEA